MKLKTQISIYAVLTMMTVSSCGGLSFDQDIYAEDVKPTSVDVADNQGKLEESQTKEMVTALVPPDPVLSVQEAEEAVAVPVQDVIKKPVSAADLLIASSQEEESKSDQDVLNSLPDAVSSVQKTEIKEAQEKPALGALLSQAIEEEVEKSTAEELSEETIIKQDESKINNEIDVSAKELQEEMIKEGRNQTGETVKIIDETIQRTEDSTEKELASLEETTEDLAKPDYIPLRDVPDRPVLTAQERAEQIRRELQQDIERSRALRRGQESLDQKQESISQQTSKEPKLSQELEVLPTDTKGELIHTRQTEESLSKVVKNTKETAQKSAKEEIIDSAQDKILIDSVKNAQNDLADEAETISKYEPVGSIAAPSWDKTMAKEKQEDLLARLSKEEKIMRHDLDVNAPEVDMNIESLEDIIQPTQPLSVKQLYQVTVSKEDRPVMPTGTQKLSDNKALSRNTLVPFDPGKSLNQETRRSVFLVDQNPVLSAAEEKETLASTQDNLTIKQLENNNPEQDKVITKTSDNLAQQSWLSDQAQFGDEREGKLSSTLDQPLVESAIASQPAPRPQPDNFEKATQSITNLPIRQEPAHVAQQKKPTIIYRPQYYVVPVYVQGQQQPTQQPQHTGQPVALNNQQFLPHKGQTLSGSRMDVSPEQSYEDLPAYRRPVRRRSTGLFVTPKPTAAEKEMASRRVLLTSDELKRVNEKLVHSLDKKMIKPEQAVGSQQYVSQPTNGSIKAVPQQAGNDEPFNYSN